MQTQAVIAHNLANSNSTGFRAVRQSLDSVPVTGPGLDSRVNSVARPESWDASSGDIIITGSALDIALQGDGWIAVQDADGAEAYTRAGNFHLTPAGVLETAEGHVVMGTAGPITLPAYSELSIKGDGRISIVPAGQTADTVAEVNTIKLVNPPREDLARFDDGLFRLKEGGAADADPTVRILSGHLESSNVNTTETLVDMIAAARHYELHVRAMSNAEQNDQAVTSLMRLNG